MEPVRYLNTSETLAKWHTFFSIFDITETNNIIKLVTQLKFG